MSLLFHKDTIAIPIGQAKIIVPNCSKFNQYIYKLSTTKKHGYLYINNCLVFERLAKCTATRKKFHHVRAKEIKLAIRSNLAYKDTHIHKSRRVLANENNG